MKKRLILFLTLILVFSFIFSACGSNDPSETDELGSDQDIVFEGCVLDVSTPSDYPESASIIKADRIAYDELTFSKATGDDAYLEKSIIEGSGLVYRDSRDGGFYFLLSVLDGNFGDQNRNSTGVFSFSFTADDDPNMGMTLLNASLGYVSFDTSVRRTSERFDVLAGDDTNDTVLSVSEKYESIFSAIGVDTSSLKLENIGSISATDQMEIEGNMLGGLSEADFSDGVTLYWRQYFEEIPVNRYPWKTRINLENNSGLCQQITAFENNAGTYGYDLKNVMVPREYSEKKAVVDFKSVASDLDKRLLMLFDENTYYLADAELCYLIYEDGDGGFTLYPAWVFIVDTESKVNNGDVAVEMRYTDERFIFTYDAFSGELIQSLDLPAEK